MYGEKTVRPKPGTTTNTVGDDDEDEDDDDDNRRDDQDDEELCNDARIDAIVTTKDETTYAFKVNLFIKYSGYSG